MHHFVNSVRYNKKSDVPRLFEGTSLWNEVNSEATSDGCYRRLHKIAFFTIHHIQMYGSPSTPRLNYHTNKRQMYGSQSTQALLTYKQEANVWQSVHPSPTAIHIILCFIPTFFKCLPFRPYLFGLQLWNLAASLILTCSFSWWGSFLRLMKLNWC